MFMSKKLSILAPVQRALGMILTRWLVLKAQPHAVGSARLWRVASLLPANPPTALNSPRTTPASATKNARPTGTVATTSLFAKLTNPWTALITKMINQPTFLAYEIELLILKLKCQISKKK